MQIKYITLAYSIGLLLIGCLNQDCLNHKNILIKNNPSDIYLYAQQKLYNGNCNNDTLIAIKNFKFLKNYNLITSYAQQIQLNLIYAYYKLTSFSFAQSSINNFLLFNSNHPNIDYVIYMQGLINMARDSNNLLQGLFGINSNTNTKYVRTALLNFIQLINTYPNSQYSDNIKYIIYLKNSIADYELSIIKYYYKCESYIAVNKRVEKMLRNFENTKAIKKALFFYEKSYEKLYLNY
ncbi:Outer membrane protein assembly factor BamD [secondary endosymbiont of Trabutina mannipara]|uniref:Outer membrane protein assembly factor BamD n=1 Tax=secondary endosymbiont of Trabutina mannipara TaxID=1835721 RepID=A0A1C3L3U2_9ENTR|nr:outer membrane protein assembly factor BamD [secondary endosymbiont of Trabutina mannipara]SBT81925.1 Outer membrane protein assembly factor BamD [secondary endosymbiont of Trabutina mannipara]